MQSDNVQIMLSTGGKDAFQRRVEVLKQLGVDFDIAVVAEGEHQGKMLKDLLASESEQLKGDAAKARAALVAYMGERLVSNTAVRCELLCLTDFVVSEVLSVSKAHARTICPQPALDVDPALQHNASCSASIFVPRTASWLKLCGRTSLVVHTYWTSCGSSQTCFTSTTTVRPCRGAAAVRECEMFEQITA
jgi:hypothetical protein